MPHVILNGCVEFSAVAKKFAPQVRHVREWITKLTDVFVSANGKAALFEALAVAQGVTHNFYVCAEQKGDHVSVRIDQRTNVEKNTGVKLAVAIVAGLLREVEPKLCVVKTNLPAEVLEAERLC